MRLILFVFLSLVIIIGCSNATDSTEAVDVESEINESPILIHAVYFNLKDSLSDSQHEEFVNILSSFSEIEAVESVDVGRIAETGDRRMGDFDIALTVMVSSIDKLAEYSNDPIHLEGKELVGHYLKEAPVVYDFWSYD